MRIAEKCLRTVHVHTGNDGRVPSSADGSFIWKKWNWPCRTHVDRPVHACDTGETNANGKQKTMRTRTGIIAAFLLTKISRACRVRYTTTWHIVITFVRSRLWRHLIRHARPSSDKMKHFCHKIRHSYGKHYLVSSVWSRSEDALILCSDGGGREIFAGIYTGCPVRIQDVLYLKNIKTFFKSPPKFLNEKMICEHFRIDPVTHTELSLSILVFSLFIAILTISIYYSLSDWTIKIRHKTNLKEIILFIHCILAHFLVFLTIYMLRVYWL